jgi:hypothetical protein
MAFVIKAEVSDPRAKTFTFTAQNAMYGGKHITKGDTVFVFASENEGGQGLVARGVVDSTEPTAKKRGIARQTPRMSSTIGARHLRSGRWGGTNSSASPAGTTAGPDPSSTSNSIVRPPTRSAASRMKRLRSWVNSSRTG